jgi:hypothetical protein
VPSVTTLVDCGFAGDIIHHYRSELDVNEIAVWQHPRASHGRPRRRQKGHWVTGQKSQRVNDRGIFASRLRRNFRERNIAHEDWNKGEIQVLVRLHFSHKVKVRWEFLGKRDVNEADALAQEKTFIGKYLGEECCLANDDMNPAKHTVDQVVAWVLAGDSTPSHAGEELEFKD